MTMTTLAPQGPDALIGERVHQLIWRARTTQTEVAPHLGITQTALSRKLRGERPWFPSELVAVAEHFGVTVGYLFGETTEPRPEMAGALSGLPRLDLNQRPSDYVEPQVKATSYGRYLRLVGSEVAA